MQGVESGDEDEPLRNKVVEDVVERDIAMSTRSRSRVIKLR